ncbi:MAG: hypothetical protein NZM04_08990 [Methylacidiphilales bacterium]|nr:hypothetical protein [Candidatus Methylacidiphilales bacterium]MDW8349863.1 hypothetical protein [Verrucomicrobiae bacterium]
MRLFLYLLLLIFWAGGTSGAMGWFSFGGQKKKAPEDERIEAIQEKQSGIRKRDEYRARILSPSDLARSKDSRPWWQRSWKKTEVEGGFSKSFLQSSRRARGFDSEAVFRTRNHHWNDSFYEDVRWKARFRDEKSEHPWSERQLTSESDRKARGFDRSLPLKAYQGKELALIQRDLERINDAFSMTGEFPDRPLTLGEVRDLLNRGRIREETQQRAEEEVRRAQPVR